MANVYIGIGSNQGDRIDYCIKAITAITRFAVIKSLSSVYETEPAGVIDQPDFINCVVEIETALDPYKLLSNLLDIEDELGRKRVGTGGPRTIDLDLIFYDDLVVQGEDLTIPHPRAHLRRFVLDPLCEIAPDFVHPILNVSVSKLLNDLEEKRWVNKVGTFPQ